MAANSQARTPGLCQGHGTLQSALHTSFLKYHRRIRFPVALPSSTTDTAVTAPPATSSTTAVQYSYILPRQTMAMFASGAALGPFCDGLHSQNNVLHYEHPSVQLQLDLASLHWSFETCWWVPLLFGLAGAIIGVSVPLLDSLLAQKTRNGMEIQHEAAYIESPSGQKRQDESLKMAQQQQAFVGAGPVPSWGAVLLCISLFVTQYGLSGVLEQPLLGQTLGATQIPTLDSVLPAYAILHWYVFDRTPQGFGMSALTAVCGPVIEMGLINLLGLYHYTHPVVFGVPAWIPWVYFCGGPAVGNLGRRVWCELAADAGELGRQQTAVSSPEQL